MSHDSTHAASRLEALSDGIFAVIITITVLNIRIPETSNLAALTPVIPVLFSYIVSFAFLIIYWNNHHNLLRHVHKVTPGIMWANAHLLFWLSLTPFATIWVGENGLSATPAALYSVLLFLAAIAYSILQHLIVTAHGADSHLRQLFGSNWKGRISPILYLLSIVGAFITPWISYALIVAVALLWIVPDRRFGRARD